MAQIQLGRRRWVHDLWVGKKYYLKLFWWDTVLKQVASGDLKVPKATYNANPPNNLFDLDDLIEQYCVGTTLRQVRYGILQTNTTDDPSIYFDDTALHASCAKDCSLEFADPPLSIGHESGQDLDDGSVAIHANSNDDPITFSLDDTVYQSSNIFTGLAPGDYTAYAKDSNPDQVCKISLSFTIIPFYGIIYRHIFDESVETGGREIKIEIGKKDYSGSVTVVDYSEGESPVMIEWVGDPENKDKVIIGSQATVSLIDQIGFQFTDLFSTTERDYRVDIYIDNVLDWTGYILPDTYEEDYVEEPYVARIVATDGLGYLKNIEFRDDYNQLIEGRKTEMSIITQCLRKLDLDVDLYENLDLYEDSMAETNADSPLTQAELNTDLYFDDDGFPINCYDVLVNVLSKYNAHILQAGANYHIVRKPKAGSSYLRRRYNLNGGYLDNETFDPILNIDQSEVISVNNDHVLNTISNYKRIIVSYEPQPYRNLIIDGDFEEFAWDDENTLLNWTKEGAATLVKFKTDEGFAVSLEDTQPNALGEASYIQSTPVEIVVDEDSQFHFSFQYYIETEDLNEGIAPTVKMYMMLKIGDYYFYDIIQEEESSRGGSGTVTTAIVKFTTTPTVNEIEVERVNSWENYSLRIPELLFGCPAQAISGDVSVRLYQAFNDDAESTPLVRTVFDNVRLSSYNLIEVESAPIQERNGTYRRRRTIVPAPPFIKQEFYANIPASEKGLTYEYSIFHADGPVAESRAAITVNDVLTTNWHRKGVTENRELSDLLLQALVNNNYLPAWYISGSYRGNISILNSFIDSNQPSKKFVITTGIYDVKHRIWNLNLVELQTTERTYDVWRIDTVPDDNTTANTGGKTNSALNNIVIGGLSPNKVVVTDDSGQQTTLGGTVGHALFMTVEGPAFMAVPSGSGGEANTASNLGTGEGVFASKVSVNLQFKSLIAGTNITITSTATEITINSTGGGDNNKVAVDAAATADFLGAGANNGVLRVGSNLTYTDGGDFVTIDADEVAINYWTLSGSDIYYEAGQVAIGTTSPIAGGQLHVESLTGEYGLLVTSSANPKATMGVHLSDWGVIGLTDALHTTTVALSGGGDNFFNSGGNFIIGGTSGTADLDVTGTVRLRNFASGLLEVDASGNVGVDTSTYLTSESDTLDSVTTRGATTTNAISVGAITGSFAAAASDTDAFLVSDSGTIKTRTGAQVVDDIGAWKTTGTTVIPSSDTIQINNSGTFILYDLAVFNSGVRFLDSNGLIIGGYLGTGTVTLGNSTAGAGMIISHGANSITAQADNSIDLEIGATEWNYLSTGMLTNVINGYTTDLIVDYTDRTWPDWGNVKKYADDNFYTQTQLQTSGQSSVHWDNITNEPSFINGAGTASYIAKWVDGDTVDDSIISQLSGVITIEGALTLDTGTNSLTLSHNSGTDLFEITSPNAGIKIESSLGQSIQFPAGNDEIDIVSDKLNILSNEIVLPSITGAHGLVITNTDGLKIGTASTQKIGLYGTTPIVQPSAILAAKTAVTEPSSFTYDNSITFDQVTIGGPWAFTTEDEAKSLVSAVRNTMLRIDSINTILQQLGLTGT